MTYAKADCSRPEGPCEPSDEPACVGELLVYPVGSVMPPRRLQESFLRRQCCERLR